MNANAADEQRLLENARAAVAALPGVVITPADDTRQVGERVPDLVLAASVKGRPVRLVFEARAGGYPRDIREAIHQLDRYRWQDEAMLTVPVLVAPAISRQARALLREAKVGYWDASGSLYLDLPSALFWIDRRPPPAAERRLRTLFRGRAAEVVHALLIEPNRAWRVRELAAMLEMAPSTVHQVFAQLERELWVEKRGKGHRAERFVVQPGAVLDAWAEVHSLKAYDQRRFHGWAPHAASVRDLVLSMLEQQGDSYALTLSSGAQLVAPFATDFGRLTVLLPDTFDLDAVAASTGLRPVEEGENVLFLVTDQRASLRFRQRLGGVWVASNVQLYLDLWVWPGRGKEQARQVRRERLGY